MTSHSQWTTYVICGWIMIWYPSGTWPKVEQLVITESSSNRATQNSLTTEAVSLGRSGMMRKLLLSSGVAENNETNWQPASCPFLVVPDVKSEPISLRPDFNTVPNQNYPQGVFNPVYACFTVVEDTRCILRMHNERIYSVTLAIHNSCITHDAHRV